MMKLKNAIFLSLGVVILSAGIVKAATFRNQENLLSGEVSRVWEDGFRLKNTDRSIRVDTWDVCGDNTARSVEIGDQVTVTGEFERGEFDAFSITKADGSIICS